MVDASTDTPTSALHGRLLSTRMPAMIGVLLFLTFLFGVALNHAALMFGSVLAAFVLAIMHWLMPTRCAWHPSARFALYDDGYELVHRNGRSEFAPWAMFEKARIKALSGFASVETADGQRWWKLTLLNTYKPAIGAYLHTRTANHLTFYFPVEIMFRATARDAQAMQATLDAMIQRDDAADTAQEHDSLFDLAPTLWLSTCIMCDCSLRGLPARGACPECGWSYDEHTFAVHIRTTTKFAALMWMIVLCFIILWILVAPRMLHMYNVMTLSLIMSVTTMLSGIGAFLIGAFVGSADRLLITGDGIELWGKGRRRDLYAWADFGDIRSARIEGQWRLGFWHHPLPETQYSAWANSSQVVADVDKVLEVILQEPVERSALLADTIIARWRNAVPGATAIETAT